ncbi:MAG: ABC transporter permease [Oscillospiraceae bacterium]|nr:ABC transporter permease [Oscillospiraceae bacterium]
MSISFKYITKRLRQYALTTLVAALAISMTIAVTLAADSLKDSVVYASMPFDMIVGAKGSAAQLALNAVFLRDTPVGNVDQAVYERYMNDGRARRIIPLAFGDSYRGSWIVGSSEALFTLRPSEREPEIFQIQEGRFFQDKYELVVGSEAARRLGLAVGDTVKASHGMSDILDEELAASRVHNNHIYTVVGALKPMRRPYDLGMFASIETFWDIHGGGERGVSAFIVTPWDYVGLMSMYQELNTGSEAQGVFPGEVAGDLFGVIGRGEEALRLVSYAVAALGFATVILSLYWSVLNRRKENAIFRALGAGRSTLLRMVVTESAMVMLVSAPLGLLFGHLVSGFIGLYLRRVMAVYVPASFSVQELYILAAYAAIGAVGAALPAASAYRQDVAGLLAGE